MNRARQQHTAVARREAIFSLHVFVRVCMASERITMPLPNPDESVRVYQSTPTLG